MTEKKFNFSASQVFVLGFILTILLGTLLLTLPFSHIKDISFIDALFTATSATCVTGLTTIPITTHFSTIGQLIILFLIQIGGIGIMGYGAFISLLLYKAFTRSSSQLQSIMDIYDVEKFRSIVISIFTFTITIELIGSILLYFSEPLVNYPPLKRAYFAAFHAVSAFCNAGFSLFSDSFEQINSGSFLFIIMALIILGGVGFWVLLDIQNINIFSPKKTLRNMSLHSKIALSVTIVLLLLGTCLFYISESNYTMAGLGQTKRMLHAVFLSVTARTAGFNSLPTAELANPTIFLLLILMLIGASPGSTGGGIKTTTIGILSLKLWQIITMKKDVEAFRRRIPEDNIIKALAILFISMIILSIGIFLLFLYDDHGFRPIIFESISAFGTVGLSTGITSELNDTAKFILSLMMLAGRVGPLTLALSLTISKKYTKYALPEEKVLVG